jgi:phosphoglycolate phosphatase
MSQKLRAIIFDFDGVIIDSYHYSRGIVKAIGHDVSEENFKAHHDGNVFEKPKIPFTEESSEDFYRRYHNKVQQQRSFLSLEDLKKLHSKFQLFIISSNGETVIEKFLSYHELHYFKEVLGAQFHKSKIKKFKHLFSKYDLDADECLFIADTLGDILEARQVGVKTIAVDFGFHDRERLLQGKPYKMVSSFEEVMSLINEIK